MLLSRRYVPKILNQPRDQNLTFSINRRSNGNQKTDASLQNYDIVSPLLIANRGEIACRIIKTARKLGIPSVAVYSDADRSALHVRNADKAYLLGPAPSLDSYLNMQKIMNVIEESGSRAVHPGYGFLSENAEFAQRLAEKGVIFVGPPASSIRSMGLKNTAKSIMHAAGVPIIEGYHGDNQDDKYLKAEAERIGFPIMLKAVRGGGGKGMRICKSAQDFDSQLGSARREALKSFGNDDMIVEKFVENPRHVEVQVFGDSHNNYVYLFERDCSVQRRHQKIIEEAPAPNISDLTRQRLGQAACRAAAAVGYVGAGTVEFIMDADQKFYFMEMNTRLQVEHPVTEMITGFDLVEWQLLVACGQRLPVSDQNRIELKGHSFEARIYAEDPDNDFVPGAGFVPYLSLSEDLVKDPHVRLETGIEEGDHVSVHYDPMIAKLVVWSPDDRRTALAKLRNALAGYNLIGLKTNISFLDRLAKHHEFEKGNVYTDFIRDYAKDLFPEDTTSSSNTETVVQAVLASILLDRKPYGDEKSHDPFSIPDYFHNNLTASSIYQLKLKDIKYKAGVRFLSDNQFVIDVGNSNSNVKIINVDFDSTANRCHLKINAEINSRISMINVVAFGDTVTIFNRKSSDLHEFEAIRPDFADKLNESSVSGASNDCLAPMPGVIEKVLVKPGTMVNANDPLIVMVAMKMEYVIKSPGKRTVDKILCQVGDNVPRNAHLVTFAQ